MLNECLAMARGLEAAGFAVEPRHPDVQTPGKRAAVRVRLDAAGRPAEVEIMAAVTVSAAWTFANGNHNQALSLQTAPSATSLR